MTASINREVTLLAFTALHTFEDTGQVYDSFVVAIQSADQVVVNLNTAHPRLQRVVFLRKDASEPAKTSHFLLFRHQESIDLFTVHTEQDRQGKKVTIANSMLSGKPIASRFIWYQWDQMRQVVFYLHLRPTVDTQDGNLLGYETVLKCIHFSRARQEIKLDLALRLEHLWTKFSEAGAGEQTLYEHLPCSNTVYFANFNMQVVHMGGKGICVCFQHAPATTPLEDGSLQSITYSVFVLHHSCVLEYAIPVKHPHPEKLRLYFSCLREYAFDSRWNDAKSGR